MIHPYCFNDWPDAFDYCREVNRPILAAVGEEEAKIFPSGRLEPRNAAWRDHQEAIEAKCGEIIRRLTNV